MVEAVGIEPTARPCNDKDLQQSIAQKAENEAGFRAETAPAETPPDPDLRAVIEAWPDLPKAIRAGIVAMVTAASRDVGSGGIIEGGKRDGT